MLVGSVVITVLMVVFMLESLVSMAPQLMP